jgi:hypothetical protein
MSYEDKISKAVQQAIKEDVTDAMAEVDITYYINKKYIKSILERVVRDYIAQQVNEHIQGKLIRELNKYSPKIDGFIAQEVFREIEKKHLEVVEEKVSK